MRAARDGRIVELTPEQDEKLLRLIAYSDTLERACAVLEGAPEGEIDEWLRRLTLAVLVEYKDRAAEEAHRYQEKPGIRPE